MDRFLTLRLGIVQPPARSGQATACLAQSGAQNAGHLPPCLPQFLQHATRHRGRRPEARLALGQSFGHGWL